jgi:hypothetical protein
MLLSNRTALVGKRADVLLCLQAVPLFSEEDAVEKMALDRAAGIRMAYQCLLRRHTPRIGTRVFDTFNPHLVLFALCCVQCLICVGRIEHKPLHSTSIGENALLEVINIPLWGIAALLGLLLVAACTVHAIHDTDLLGYPTVIALLFVSVFPVCFYVFVHSKAASLFPVDPAWELAFHLQVVAVPLALLVYALFGPRLWADLLCHACLLSAAVNLFWLQQHKGTPVWLARCMVVALVVLSLHLIQVQFGPFDTWRYAFTYMGCIGLAPLLLLSLASSADNPTSHQYKKMHHNLSLSTSNAALFTIVLTLSHLF